MRPQNRQLKHTIENLRRNGIEIRTGSPYNFLLLNPEPKCTAGIDRLIVGPNLRVYPCDAFKQIEVEEIVGADDYSCLERRSSSLLDKVGVLECCPGLPDHSIPKTL